MAYYAVDGYGNELYHHGVKGMKWGVRRYQNSDGSLTPAGERRYYGKANRIQKDIDSFNPIRNGLKDKRGRVILTKQDVDNSVRGLELARDRARTKGDAKRQRDLASLQRSQQRSEAVKGKIRETKEAISRVKNDPEFKKKTETAKKVAIGAVVVAGVSLAAYGGYKISKSEGFNKAMANHYLSKADKAINSSKTASRNATEFGRRSRGFRSAMQYSNNPDTIMRMHAKANANAKASNAYRSDADRYKRRASKYTSIANRYVNRAYAARYTGRKFTKNFGDNEYRTIRR